MFLVFRAKNRIPRTAAGSSLSYLEQKIAKLEFSSTATTTVIDKTTPTNSRSSSSNSSITKNDDDCKRDKTPLQPRQAAPNSKFKKEMETSSPFTIFTCVSDLGYYGWSPLGCAGGHNYKSLENVKVHDISTRIDPAAKPKEVSSTRELSRRCPLNFHTTLAPQEHLHTFPYNSSYLVPLHVAVKHRGLDPTSVQFVFGGSTLNMLATKKIPPGAKYLAQRVPGTTIVILAKHKEYVQNYSNFGFQFERFLTGGQFEDRHDESTTGHLQVMQLGGQYSVLFSADIDAIDIENEHPVEIKASNPNYWGTRVMFQMMSSGSLSLHSGKKKGQTLRSIDSQSLRQVTDIALRGESVAQLERNVLQGMRILQDAIDVGRFENDEIMEMVPNGNNNSLQLIDSNKNPRVLLPPTDIVKAFL